MATYYNDGTGNYVSAAEHFGYRFEHTTYNLIGGPYGLADFAEENCADVDRMISDGVIELDYETGDYYIDSEADVLDYLIDAVDDDDDEDDVEGAELFPAGVEEPDPQFIAVITVDGKAVRPFRSPLEDWKDAIVGRHEECKANGIYEDKMAEAAAEAAVELISEIDDTQVEEYDLQEAITTFRIRLDAAARVEAYNASIRRWCLEDVLPEASLEVTLGLYGEYAEAEENEDLCNWHGWIARYTTDDGVEYFSKRHPSLSVAYTLSDWNLVEGSSRMYQNRVDNNVTLDLIEY